MKKTFFNKLVCPFDKADLTLQIYKQESDEILEGIMTCTVCNRYYPIVYGIPIMTPDEYREQRLELPLLERWGLMVGNDVANSGEFRLIPQNNVTEISKK